MKITLNKEEIDEIMTDAIIKILKLKNIDKIGTRYFIDRDGNDIDVIQQICGYMAEVDE